MLTGFSSVKQSFLKRSIISRIYFLLLEYEVNWFLCLGGFALESYGLLETRNVSRQIKYHGKGFIVSVTFIINVYGFYEIILRELMVVKMYMYKTT